MEAEASGDPVWDKEPCQAILGTGVSNDGACEGGACCDSGEGRYSPGTDNSTTMRGGAYQDTLGDQTRSKGLPKEGVCTGDGASGGDSENIRSTCQLDGQGQWTEVCEAVARAGYGDSLTVRQEGDGRLNVAVKGGSNRTCQTFTVDSSCLSGTCVCVYVLSGMPCQLKPCRFFSEAFCRTDIDVDAMFILQGIVFGFRVIDENCNVTYNIKRQRSSSAGENEIIESRLQAELHNGLLIEVDKPPACVHGIFVVPKDDGGGRTVIDCSKPDSGSVNNYTAGVAPKFKYLGIDDVVDLLERNDYLASIDIKDAYRAVQIHPDHRTLQGLRWLFNGNTSETYLMDGRLCMGLSSSPYIFTRLSNFIVRCAGRDGVSRVINYLDDFCIIGRTEDETTCCQQRLLAILRRLGFFISFKKLISPSKKIRFLGIDVNSETLELTLPDDKLLKLRQTLNLFLGRKKATRRELERLAGYLAHCAKVTRGGRTFSRRVYDLICTLQKPFYKARLNAGFRSDITWWAKFASKFNGKAGMLGKFAAIASVYSDASNWGLGATHGNDWLVAAFEGEADQLLESEMGHHHVRLPGGVQVEHINVKEMRGVLEGAIRWAPSWGDSEIIFITDSAVVQAALNTGRSRSSGIMAMLRQLFWLAVENNFTFVSTYINTTVNVVCDALSRLDAATSAARIRAVDVGRTMCCAHLFDYPLSCHFRAREIEGGAKGL